MRLCDHVSVWPDAVVFQANVFQAVRSSATVDQLCLCVVQLCLYVVDCVWP